MTKKLNLGYKNTKNFFVRLGPRGEMERIDVVHGFQHVATSFRRDWELDSCTPVYAASKEHAVNCPNDQYYF